MGACSGGYGQQKLQRRAGIDTLRLGLSDPDTGGFGCRACDESFGRKGSPCRQEESHH